MWVWIVGGLRVGAGWRVDWSLSSKRPRQSSRHDELSLPPACSFPQGAARGAHANPGAAARRPGRGQAPSGRCGVLQGRSASSAGSSKVRGAGQRAVWKWASPCTHAGRFQTYGGGAAAGGAVKGEGRRVACAGQVRAPSGRAAGVRPAWASARPRSPAFSEMGGRTLPAVMTIVGKCTQGKAMHVWAPCGVGLRRGARPFQQTQWRHEAGPAAHLRPLAYARNGSEEAALITLGARLAGGEQVERSVPCVCGVSARALTRHRPRDLCVMPSSRFACPARLTIVSCE
jgi:hypothetical protein